MRQTPAMATALQVPVNPLQLRVQVSVKPELQTFGASYSPCLCPKQQARCRRNVGNNGSGFEFGVSQRYPRDGRCFEFRQFATEVARETSYAEFLDTDDERADAPVVEKESVDLEFGGVLKTLGHTRTLPAIEFRGDEDDGAPTENSMAGWESNEKVLGCCERGKALKVAVLVSGGVDSSVALRLLCAAGHSCTAFYLKIWFQEDFENFWSDCPWEEDLKYAQAVCDEVGVDLRVVHLTDKYWKLVILLEEKLKNVGRTVLLPDLQVSNSISEIQAGRTPNPDILCNSCIKFGAFLEHIQEAQFDRVASGHYARVRRDVPKESIGEEKTELLLSADQVKDQTYFLSYLRQEQLSRLLFPLGGLSKVEVRQIAEAMRLNNKHRKDSQGICFLGKVKFSAFIAKHLGEMEGRLVEAETGELLGLHKGFWFYTLGQRQGLYLANGPWFVVAKDVKHNVVFVSRKYYSEDKQRRSFRVASFNWFAGSPPADTCSLQCKVRHGAKLYDCSLNFEDLKGDPVGNASTNLGRTAVVKLSEHDQGLAPGQYTAFYQGDICLGSAVITEALAGVEDLSVSAIAQETATQPFDAQAYKSSKRKISSSLKETSNPTPKARGLNKEHVVDRDRGFAKDMKGSDNSVKEGGNTSMEDVISPLRTLSTDEVRVHMKNFSGAQAQLTHRGQIKPGWRSMLQRLLQVVLPE